MFLQLTTHLDNSKAFQALAIISALCNAFFFFLMLWIKELQAHPMKLFMVITACDSTLLFLYFIELNMCSFGLHKLFAWTVYFNTDCATYLKSVNTLLNTGQLAMNFSATLSGCLQVCICLDLILIIKSPFKPKEARVPVYYIYSLIIAIV